MGAPWLSNSCLSYPHIWLPFPVGPSPTDFHIGTTNNYHSATTVHQQESVHCPTFSPCCFHKADTQHLLQATTSLPLSFYAYNNTTHKDGSKNSDTSNLHSGSSSWKFAPQELQKWQLSDPQKTTKGFQK